ncbi:hypothetical protein ABB37_05798 [Leptomonas pyrrhocoris]|uniref:AAA+ ATPase domain-containing protein n=1 Tax=Leptomonas pyrrhocoris TaxID=157538 RepID=A0A0N0VF20_LEPPY|nr:hypothetical protein ABB37_05798 [Leptomonas pyrrhocoris]KPA79351.1 hypothetical protein ABB37_05798 [Leptomonas pyrrhocoris]|eukprot:XP_015657790.1 hypothetical protein ABB37_05798 [Leptomonas pyrrhocoris]
MRSFLITALSIVCVCLACIVYVETVGSRLDCTALYCPAPPLCDQATRTFSQRVVCGLGKSPLKPGSKEFRAYVVTRLHGFVKESLKGQLMAPAVVEMVEYKLHHPYEPMVLHFAGDNGVGKTRLAELISLAYGQRCGDELCTVGDSTLVLSGTGYDGLSTAEFRKAVVELVTRHARRHPRDGVVVINELSSLEPGKVRVLLPLLGRASEFPEHFDVKISTQLVVLTTDFGREGRTRGKGLSEMRSFINSEFTDLYSAQFASHVRTLPFLPISLDTAGEIVRVVAKEIGCSATPPVRLAITDTAVLWLVEKTKGSLAVENGRAVAQETKLHVGSLMERLQADEASHPSSKTLRPRDGAANCSVPACNIYVDDGGQIGLAC